MKYHYWQVTTFIQNKPAHSKQGLEHARVLHRISTSVAHEDTDSVTWVPENAQRCQKRSKLPLEGHSIYWNLTLLLKPTNQTAIISVQNPIFFTLKSVSEGARPLKMSRRMLDQSGLVDPSQPCTSTYCFVSAAIIDRQKHSCGPPSS